MSKPTKIRLKTDEDGHLHVYKDTGEEITGIISLSVDHDIETGQTLIALVYEVDLEFDDVDGMLTGC